MDIKEILIAYEDNRLLGLIKYLVEHGVDIHAHNDFALQWAGFYGHLNIIKYLVEECGADIHAENDYVLRWAINNHYSEIIKYLIKHNPNQEIIDDAIIFAANTGNLDTIKFFIEIGANIDNCIDAVLLLAAKNEYLDIIKYLNKVYKGKK